jgi:hypothetical protein
MVEVRNHDGDLVRRVSPSQAAALVARGLASPIGRNTVKHLLLHCDEPAPACAWRGSSCTTFKERIPMHTGLAPLYQHKRPRRPGMERSK